MSDVQKKRVQRALQGTWYEAACDHCGAPAWWRRYGNRSWTPEYRVRKASARRWTEDPTWPREQADALYIVCGDVCGGIMKRRLQDHVDRTANAFVEGIVTFIYEWPDDDPMYARLHE